MRTDAETLHLMYEAVNSGDVDGTLQFLDPAIEFRDLPQLPGSGIYHGHPEMRGWFAGIQESFDEIRYEPVQVIEEGDAYLAPTHASGTGRGSGALVEMDFVSVWWFRDGLVIRHEAFPTEEAARAALES